MVMRTTKFGTKDYTAPSPLVGGGILERKIMIARNGTERTHAEDREMECCHHVMVGGDQFGGNGNISITQSSPVSLLEGQKYFALIGCFTSSPMP